MCVKEANLHIAFEATKSERFWLTKSLKPFEKSLKLDRVVAPISGGKEAMVYLCRIQPENIPQYIIAKIYRPRRAGRNRNEAMYMEGRKASNVGGRKLGLEDWRQQRKIQKDTGLGSAMRSTTWLQHEFETMQLLHKSGADIPMPIAVDANAFLMTFFGENHVAAPLLHRIRLEKTEAKPLFERLLWNVEMFLNHDRVHGDLSAYNVLYWKGTCPIIDFSQTVIAGANPYARELLHRDIDNLCQYFKRYGIEADPINLTESMWTRYKNRRINNCRGDSPSSPNRESNQRYSKYREKKRKQ